jgi:hypothetical protein
MGADLHESRFPSRVSLQERKGPNKIESLSFLWKNDVAHFVQELNAVPLRT